MTWEVEQLFSQAHWVGAGPEATGTGPQPDQRCQAHAWGSWVLHVRPRADPGAMDISKCSLDVQHRFLIESSQLRPGRTPLCRCAWLVLACQADFPEREERPRWEGGSTRNLVCGGRSRPQPPQWSPPSPHTPREGKVREMTRVFFVCGLFFPPGKSDSEAVFQVFVLVSSVPS